MQHSSHSLHLTTSHAGLAAQVLPDSLTDAIAQASESTVTAMRAGSDRIVVRHASMLLFSALFD